MKIVIVTDRTWFQQITGEAIEQKLPSARIRWAQTMREAHQMITTGDPNGMAVIFDVHTPPGSDEVTAPNLIKMATAADAWIVVVYEIQGDLTVLGEHTGSAQHGLYDIASIVESLRGNRNH